MQSECEAALFGAAYRAKYSLYLNSIKASNDVCNGNINIENSTFTPLSYHDYVMQFIPNLLQLICEPSKDCEQIYAPMLQRYRKMAAALAQN